MAFASDLPHSFKTAVAVAEKILSRNLNLVRRDVVDVEAELIVVAAYWRHTGKLLSRMEFFAKLPDALPPEAAKNVVLMATHRSEGQVLQHLTGIQHFLGHAYEVSPDVLVPRPETEILAAQAIERLRLLSGGPARGIEIGLGSGILSIELLSEFKSLRMTSSEFSAAAVQIAIKNASNILGLPGLQRLEVVVPQDSRHVLQPFEAQRVSKNADFLISNPPYMTSSDGIDPEVLAHEPHEALFAPKDDPLHFYREIAEQAGGYLRAGGYVFLEMPHERATQIQDLFVSLSHHWKSVEVVTDLNHRARVLIAQIRS